MLIKERRIVIAREPKTEFNGIFHPGVTYMHEKTGEVKIAFFKCSWLGWGGGGLIYICEEIREWHPPVTSK
jgi:hypothetical protein